MRSNYFSSTTSFPYSESQFLVSGDRTKWHFDFCQENGFLDGGIVENWGPLLKENSEMETCLQGISDCSCPLPSMRFSLTFSFLMVVLGSAQKVLKSLKYIWLGSRGLMIQCSTSRELWLSGPRGACTAIGKASVPHFVLFPQTLLFTFLSTGSDLGRELQQK